MKRIELSAEGVDKLLSSAASEAESRIKSVPVDWTAVMLGALASHGRELGLLADPDDLELQQTSGRKHGEHLWDLTLSSYPLYEDVGYVFPAYFRRIDANRPPELRLIAESEWGKRQSRVALGFQVMDDFLKVLAGRCPLKVMIFGYHGNGTGDTSFGALAKMMCDIINVSDDTATYVLFGCDWQSWDHQSRLHARTHHPRAE